MYSKFVLASDFARSDTEIGRKMANGQLLFQALICRIAQNFGSGKFWPKFSNMRRVQTCEYHAVVLDSPNFSPPIACL